ncbi:MAG: potassium transporter TrkG [Akkermansia sp.]
MLILFIVLWQACFMEAGVSEEQLLNMEKASLVLTAGLAFFNTFSVLVHLIATYFQRSDRPPLLWIQLLIGAVMAPCLVHVLQGERSVTLMATTLVCCLLIGGLAVLNLISYIQAHKNADFRPGHKNWSPAVVFFTGMVAFILVSTLLLMTPGATYNGIRLEDAFFTCASASAITGLMSIDVGSTFTPFGKCVVLMDFQVGAMGVMTFSFFLIMLLGKRLGVQDRRVLSDILDQEGARVIPALIKSVITVTFAVEALGATALYYAWLDVPGVPQEHLWFYALFHAVSAFCNAGISLFPNSMGQECILYNYTSQSVMMLCTIAGTLGFTVYLEAMQRIKNRLQHKPNPARWGTHTWLVVRVTLIVMLTGTLLLFLLGALEPSEHGGETHRIFWESLWITVGRSTGFTLSDINTYGPAHKLFVCFLMFVGGNPTGTGGGIYAPVFALCLLEVLRILRGEQDVVLHQYRVSRRTVGRAMATIVLAGSWICLCTLVLLLLEPELARSSGGLQALFFEEVSAFTTTGYSLGITAQLCTASKLLISLNMIFGRIGMFTFMMIFIQQKDPKPFQYPEVQLPLT